mmetsp:Transcript_48323/g.156662  ORF Transcript_48323/g.156662 Transcript_48323/m.156662 type:complete len:339 (+) Transcript_48323:142-1158(+)
MAGVAVCITGQLRAWRLVASHLVQIVRPRSGAADAFFCGPRDSDFLSARAFLRRKLLVAETSMLVYASAVRVAPNATCTAERLLSACDRGNCSRNGLLQFNGSALPRLSRCGSRSPTECSGARSFLVQSFQQAACRRMLLAREARDGRPFSAVVRLRPDTVLLQRGALEQLHGIRPAPAAHRVLHLCDYLQAGGRDAMLAVLRTMASYDAAAARGQVMPDLFGVMAALAQAVKAPFERLALAGKPLACCLARTARDPANRSSTCFAVVCESAGFGLRADTPQPGAPTRQASVTGYKAITGPGPDGLWAAARGLGWRYGPSACGVCRPGMEGCRPRSSR